MSDPIFLKSPYQSLIDGTGLPPEAVRPPPAPIEPDDEDTAPAAAAPAAPARTPRTYTKTDKLTPPPELRPLFENVAAHFKVPVNVLMALAHQESRYNPDAKNAETGATGMAQYIGATAKSLGINAADPNEAIPAAAMQLRERLDKGLSIQDAIKEHFAGPDRKLWGTKTAAYGDEVMGKAAAIGQELYGAQASDAPAPAKAGAVDLGDIDPSTNLAGATGFDPDSQLQEVPRAPAAPAPKSAPAAKNPQQAGIAVPAKPVKPAPSMFDTVAGNAVGGTLSTLMGAGAGIAKLVGAKDTAEEWEKGKEQVQARMQELGGDTMPGKVAGLVGGVVPALAAPEGMIEQVAANTGLFAIPAFNDTLKAKLAEGYSRPLALVHAAEAFGVNLVMPTVASKGAGALVGKIAGAAPVGAKGVAAGLGQAATEGVGFSTLNTVLDKGTDAIAGQQNDKAWLDPEDMAVQALGFGAMRAGHMAPHAVDAALDKVAPNFQAARALQEDAATNLRAAPGADVDAATSMFGSEIQQPDTVSPRSTVRRPTDVGPSPSTRTVPLPPQQEQAAAPAPADIPAPAGTRIEPTMGDPAEAPPAPPAPAAPGKPSPADKLRAIRPPDQIAPVVPAVPDGPLTASLKDAAAAHDADPAPLPATPEPAPEPPALDTLPLADLQARVKALAEQRKTADPSMYKDIQAQRKEIEKAINAKQSQAKADSKPAEEPLAAGPFEDMKQANKMMLRHAEATGAPHEVVPSADGFRVQRIGGQGDGVDTAGAGRGTDGHGRSGRPAGADGAPDGTRPAGTGDAPGEKAGPGVASERGADAAGNRAGADGAADQPAAVAPTRDTRGTGVRFHGTSREMPGHRPNNDYAMSGDNRNIYGQGFYTTDAADISEGYMRKGKGKAPTLYEVKERGAPKLYDMEQDLTPEVRKMAERAMGDAFPEEDIDGKPITSLRALLDEFRAESQNHGLTRDEVQETFDAIRYNLEKDGYHGYRHVGGSKTGKPAHDVRIYWTPEDHVDVSKSDIAKYKGEPADVPEPAKVPEKAPAEKSTEGEKPAAAVDDQAGAAGKAADQASAQPRVSSKPPSPKEARKAGISLTEARAHHKKQEDAIRQAAENIARRKAEKEAAAQAEAAAPQPAAAEAPAPTPQAKTSTAGERMRAKVKEQNPFLAFLSEHGIHVDERSDTGAEKNRPVMVPGYGQLYRKAGLRIDELAGLAHEAGFLSDRDMNDPTDNGGTRKLADMIERAAHRKEVIGRDDHAEASMPDADAELMAEAEKLGIDIKGKSVDQVYDEVATAHADEFNNHEARLAHDAMLDADIPMDGGKSFDNLSDEDIDAIFGIQPKGARADGGQDQEGASAPAREGAAEAGAAREGADDVTGDGILKVYGRDEVVAKQDAQDATAKAEQAERERAEKARRTEQDKKDIAARQDASADDFQLGQDAHDALAGQKDIFGGAQFSVSGEHGILGRIQSILYKGRDSILDKDGRLAVDPHDEQVESKLTDAEFDQRANGDWIDAVGVPLNAHDRATALDKVNQSEWFHGSQNSDIDKLAGMSNGALFLTSDKGVAEHYAGRDGRVYPSRPEIKNPLFIKSSDLTADMENSGELAKVAARGYDAIVPLDYADIVVLDSSAPRYSTDHPLTKDAAREVEPMLRDLADKGAIVLHDDASTLPVKGEVPDGVQALTAPDGTIHVVADALHGNAMGVVLHEAFHAGARPLLGTKVWADLEQRLGSLYRQGEQSTGAARVFFDKARERVAVAKARGAVAPGMEHEEFGAYAIEEHANAPASVRKWVDDLTGAVKAWALRRFGRQLGDVTPAQLSSIAKLALMDKISARAASSEPAFSADSRKTVQVDGQRRPIENSNGKLIAQDMHKQMAFWRWAGDTKVVDEKGRPLVVYHGSFSDFDHFDSRKSEDGAFHFGTSEAAAERLAGKRGTLRGAEPDGQNVMPVYLRIMDPKRLDHDPMDSKSWKRTIAKAKVEGHDGIVYPNEQEGGESWVAFHAEQIKSATGNDGSFDPMTPDIRYSVGAPATPTVPTTAREKLAKLLKQPVDELRSIGHDVAIRVVPMATGNRDAQAVAKDFANQTRQAQAQWHAFDKVLREDFTKDELETMWNAADQENDLRRDGKTSKTKGLNSLPPEQREVVEMLHAYGEQLWDRAKKVGLVDPSKSGVDFWTPRVAANVYADGSVERLASPGGEFSKDATNLRTSASSLKKRKYETTADSEAALQTKHGADAAYVKNIRVMPLAMAQLEQAIAGRSLVNQVKALGQIGGADIISDSKLGKNYETFDHPALKNWHAKTGWQPVPKDLINEPGANVDAHRGYRVVDGEVQHLVPLLDAEGQPVMVSSPMYVHKDFVGPMKAVLKTESPLWYRRMMQLKGAVTSMVMISPLTHNMVIWGKAMPTMASTMGWKNNAKNIATLGINAYVVGYKTRQNAALMNELIGAGLVPVSGRGMSEDVQGIAAGIEPGKSWTAKVAGKAVGLVEPVTGPVARAAGKAVDTVAVPVGRAIGEVGRVVGNNLAGNAIKSISHAVAKTGRAVENMGTDEGMRKNVDAMGEFWHETLLWNRVADMQAGMAVMLRGSLMDKGFDQDTANRFAAHFANRYAGMVPQEAMSQVAHITANLALFSKSFNLTNVGAYKDVIKGLPGDVQAQILRNATALKRAAGMNEADAAAAGQKVLSHAQATARKKGATILALDIAAMTAITSLAQAVWQGQGAQQIADDFKKRAAKLGHHFMEDPFAVMSQPLQSLASLSQGEDNAPGKEDRVRLGSDKKRGDSYYMRLPMGKMGEELKNYTNFVSAMRMGHNKMSTFVRPWADLFGGNEDFQGQSIVNESSNLLMQGAQFGAYWVKSQFPAEDVMALARVANGSADTMDKAKLLGTATGLTVARVAGGDAVAEIRKQSRDMQSKLRDALPEAKEAVRRGKAEEAAKILVDAGQLPNAAKRLVVGLQNPGLISKGKLKSFMQTASPEEQEKVVKMIQEK